MDMFSFTAHTHTHSTHTHIHAVLFVLCVPVSVRMLSYLHMLLQPLFVICRAMLFYNIIVCYVDGLGLGSSLLMAFWPVEFQPYRARFYATFLNSCGRD